MLFVTVLVSQFQKVWFWNHILGSAGEMAKNGPEKNGHFFSCGYLHFLFPIALNGTFGGGKKSHCWACAACLQGPQKDRYKPASQQGEASCWSCCERTCSCSCSWTRSSCQRGNLAEPWKAGKQHFLGISFWTRFFSEASENNYFLWRGSVPQPTTSWLDISQIWNFWYRTPRIALFNISLDILLLEYVIPPVILRDGKHGFDCWS